VLSDNGMVFTTRFAGGSAGRNTVNGFSALLRDLGVTRNTPSRTIPPLAARWSASTKR
jgi:hypothetical protein